MGGAVWRQRVERGHLLYLRLCLQCAFGVALAVRPCQPAPQQGPAPLRTARWHIGYEDGLRMQSNARPQCLSSHVNPMHLQRLSQTERLGVVILAPVKGMDVGKRLSSCALVFPRSQQRWPTKAPVA